MLWPGSPISAADYKDQADLRLSQPQKGTRHHNGTPQPGLGLCPPRFAVPARHWGTHQENDPAEEGDWAECDLARG